MFKQGLCKENLTGENRQPFQKVLLHIHHNVYRHQHFSVHPSFLLGNQIGLYSTDDHRRVIQLLKNRIRTKFFYKWVKLKRKFFETLSPAC